MIRIIFFSLLLVSLLPAKVVQWEKKIFFSYKSAKLTQSAKEYLDDLAPYLKRQKNLKKSVLEVHGHTDGSNELKFPKLSEERACAVKDYLVKRHRIDAKRLRCIGHGGSEPVADNTLREGRSLNRRVVISLPEDSVPEPGLPVGDFASYRYDKLGRLIAVDYANGRKIRIEYDPSGNILKRTDSDR